MVELISFLYQHRSPFTTSCLHSPLSLSFSLTHTLPHAVDSPPPGSASLPRGVYFIRDNTIKVKSIMATEVGVATGVTSNWLITDDSGMVMNTVSGITIVDLSLL